MVVPQLVETLQSFYDKKARMLNYIVSQLEQDSDPQDEV